MEAKEETKPLVDFDRLRAGEELAEHEFDALCDALLGADTLNYRFCDQVLLGTPAPNCERLPVFRHAHMKFKKLATPPAHSLRSFSPEVYRQGELGCCVGNSMAMALRIATAVYNSRSHMRLYLTGYRTFKPSRLYIYWNAKCIEGNPPHADTGCTVHGALLATREYNICDEGVWPYERKNFTRSPSSNAFRDAQDRPQMPYRKVEQTTSSIKSSLYGGSPVMFGAVLFSSFRDRKVFSSGEIPMPDKQEKVIGAHCMLIVGYDDETRRFTIQNSWGRLWGDDGFGTMPYDYVTDADICGDFWSFDI